MARNAMMVIKWAKTRASNVRPPSAVMVFAESISVLGWRAMRPVTMAIRPMTTIVPVTA